MNLRPCVRNIDTAHHCGVWGTYILHDHIGMAYPIKFALTGDLYWKLGVYIKEDPPPLPLYCI